MSYSTNKEVSERLQIIFDALGVNANDVAKRLNIHHSTIYKMLEGGSYPNLKSIVALLDVYPQINESYLLRGAGSPLTDSNVVVVGALTDLPMYVSEPNVSYQKRIPLVRPSDIDISDCSVFEVTDNSMRPQLHVGMRVLGKPVDTSDWPFLSGVIAISYGRELSIRRVYENELSTRDTLVLSADSELSGKIFLKRSDIKRIFKIVQIISGTVE